jgi:hypothetical protein
MGYLQSLLAVPETKAACLRTGKLWQQCAFATSLVLYGTTVLFYLHKIIIIGICISSISSR